MWEAAAVSVEIQEQFILLTHEFGASLKFVSLCTQAYFLKVVWNQKSKEEIEKVIAQITVFVCLFPIPCVQAAH